MRTVPLYRVTVCLALWLSASSAAGPASERGIAREPVYRTKTPKYCLLAFGPEAQSRIWLVLDGDTLYVDRNGNGDLTDRGERVALDSSRFEAETITEQGGKVRHRNLLVLRSTGDRHYIQVDLHGGFQQYTLAAFADRPQDAPVRHFNGPLSLSVHKRPSVGRGKPPELEASVGTPNLKGEWVWVVCDGVPKDAHPTAELTFPGKGSQAKPVTVKAQLTHRC